MMKRDRAENIGTQDEESGRKVCVDIYLASFNLACALTNNSPPCLICHKLEGKNGMSHCSSDKGKHPNHTTTPPQVSDTLSLEWESVYPLA